MSYSSLILPYAIEDSGRKTRFSENMEVAALFCIAEAERKKKPGLFGGDMETLTILSKLHYPIWAIPWEKNCLLIDGVGTVSDIILYSKLPDIEAFIEHLKRSTTVHELYRSTLRSHIETFSEFISQTEKPIKGRIADKELLSDVLAFIKESKAEVERIAKSTSLIQPKIGMETAIRIGDELSEHYNRLQSDMKGLQFAIKTVEEETKTHVDKLHHEMRQIRIRHEEKISNVRTDVEKRKGDLEKERDEKVDKIANAHEGETRSRLEERKRWEQELLRLEQDKSEFEKRKELRKRKNDEIGEARWNARLQDVQNQISTVKGKIKALSEFVNRSNKETEKTTKKLHGTYQKLIEEEERKITELEELRDAEIDKKEKEIGELKQETLTITDKIERLIEQKRERTAIINDATITWTIETPTMIHIPFYLIVYKAEKGKRYSLRPPVIAKGRKGLAMKLRSLVKRANINALIKTRSKALKKMLTSFEKALQDDTILQESLNQVGASHNLVASPSFKEEIEKGMEELEVEGWIRPEEKTSILDTFVRN